MLPLNYWLYLQIILFLFITPGSPRVLIVSYSMNYGLRKSVWTALGDITANILQGTLVIFGIGTLIQNNSLALIPHLITSLFLMHVCFISGVSIPLKRIFSPLRIIVSSLSPLSPSGATSNRL